MRYVWWFVGAWVLAAVLIVGYWEIRQRIWERQQARLGRQELEEWLKAVSDD